MPHPETKAAADPKPIKQLHIGYYRRARMLGITPADTNGEPIGQETHIPLAQLIKAGRVPRDELITALEDAEAPSTAGVRMDAEFNPEFDSIREAGIPADLTGKTVLDIGGYSGEFAKLCLDRGARQAIVYDSGEYTDYGWARPVVPEGVIFQKGNLMDFGWRAPQPADVVVFYNVIYHLRDPWTALERIRLLTKETLCLCTSYVPGDTAAWQLFAADDPNEHPINETYTVFWRPTIPGLLKLLRLTGFRDIEIKGQSGDHVVVQAH